tara:strand:+ start:1028 stop:1453 length:426 start_codon:yes stop_codon:yes gene_type:complete
MGPRESLNAYLKSVTGKRFAWGSNDCLTFTNDAWRSMYGHGWADEWIGNYMNDGKVIRRSELIAELHRLHGARTIEGAIDTRWQRVNHVPPLGALVTTKKARKWITGVAMGICTGSKCAFLDKEGVIYLPLDHIDAAWVRL